MVQEHDLQMDLYNDRESGGPNAVITCSCGRKLAHVTDWADGKALVRVADDAHRIHMSTLGIPKH
jgi:hypothetical protein